MADQSSVGAPLQSSKPNKLLPAIGYKGGKRALLPRLAPLFPVSEITRYEEPFVGMGALYLHLRANGYRGPAILCDAHPDVEAFWKIVHDPITSKNLLDYAEQLIPLKPTRDLFDQVRNRSCEGIERVVHFLWLTNLSFANNPASYNGTKWETQGSKLSAIESGEKEFPWRDCVERTRAIIATVCGAPTEVNSLAEPLLATTDGEAHIYADPPYEKTHRLGYGGGVGVDYCSAIVNARAQRIVYSEKRTLDLPGWRVDSGEITQRASHGNGAEGKRTELLYIRG